MAPGEVDWRKWLELKWRFLGSDQWRGRMTSIFGCLWWKASVTVGVLEWWNPSDAQVWLGVMIVVNLVCGRERELGCEENW